MNSDFQLSNEYKNVVFINYIEGTQLFILRCIYNIYRTASDVDCVIVAINDVFDFEIDETDFFEWINEITKDKFDVLFFKNGYKFEAIQESLVFKKLLDNGIEDVIYLHEDCFIQEDKTIDKFFNAGRENNNYLFAGEIWKDKNSYRAKCCLFYLNLKLANEIYPIDDEESFSGVYINKERTIQVFPGLGKYTKYLYDNKQMMNEIDPNEFVIHRGNMFDSYKISLQHYTIFNDIQNFKNAVDWLTENSFNPGFLNLLFVKQYAYIVKKIMEYHKIKTPILDEDVEWMVSDEVIGLNTTFLLKRNNDNFVINRFNKDWNAPYGYKWSKLLEQWVKE